MSRYAERRLEWLERLDRDASDALAGATRPEQRTIRSLYTEAREAWPETMPDGWEPTPDPPELLPFGMVAALGRRADVPAVLAY